MFVRTRPAQFVLAATAALAAGLAGFSSGPARAAGTADLSVVVTQSGPATSGGNAQFVVSVTNHGPEAVTQATSTGSINVSLNGVNSASAVCATGRNSVWTCIWPTLPSGATVSYLVSGKVGSAASVTVSATISGASDPNFADNRSSATAFVAAPSPDVQLGGSASDKSPLAGTLVSLKYQIRVGKSPAPNVSLVADLGGLTFVSADALCTVTGSAVNCVVGNLPAGSSTNVTLIVATPSTAGSTTIVNAIAGSDNGDSNLSNNSTALTLTTR